MSSKTNILVLLLFLLSSTTSAQYFGERVMEKSFEQTDFFFMPNRLIPYGIGTFRNSVSGVIDDPLLNLDVNPAYLYGDTARSNYIYLDFRTGRELRDTRNIYFPYPMFPQLAISRAIFLPYPRFYVDTRREVEPVFSAAYLLRLQEGALRNLSLGATYQYVSQDEKYYPIPEDIYRSVLGADYLGASSAAANNMPIVDKYNGTDNIHQEGHFASVFAGYDIEPNLQVGTKFGRVTFSRDGSYGSQNLWDSYYSATSSSLWRNGEARNQSYSHWELTAGLNYTFEERYSVGLSAGHLWGNADQVLTRGDSSYWSYGPIGSMTQNWNYYSTSGNQLQTWNHDGTASQVGVDAKARVSTRQLLQFHYQYSHQRIDIGLNGAILDTSIGKSMYLWNAGVNTYASDYSLVDVRGGTGSTVGNFHRVGLSLQWDFNPRARLSIGMQYENQLINTNTSEAVFSNRHSRSMTVGTSQYSYFDSTAESKKLEWAFQSKLTRFTIPVFFSIKTSDVVELIFGLNRSASSWQLDDVTLALFKYRLQVYQQDTVRNANFGERYTQPEVRVSDVRTSFLAGITVAPSTGFNIRFVVVPNFVDTYDGSELSDLQWLITLNVLP